MLLRIGSTQTSNIARLPRVSYLPPSQLASAASFLILAVIGASFVAGIQLASVIACLRRDERRLQPLAQANRGPGACMCLCRLRSSRGRRGAAVHIPISPWFAIVTSSAALLVVAGKRAAEIDVLGRTGALHRHVLTRYTRSRTCARSAWSRLQWQLSASACGRSSVLPTSILVHATTDNVLFELSILPFVLGILSVELAFESGEGGAPEELVLRNRAIQVLGMACLALIAFGIYT